MCIHTKPNKFKHFKHITKTKTKKKKTLEYIENCIPRPKNGYIFAENFR